MEKKLKNLLHEISLITEVEEQYILCSKRNKEYVIARDLFTYIARDRFGMSFPTIAKSLNKRDHTTIIHAYKKVMKSLDNGEQKYIKFLPKLDIISSELKNVPYKHKWDKLYEILGTKCMICGFDDVIEVHHIVSPKLGGSHHPENILILCPNHHTMLHNGLLVIKKLGGDKIEFSTE